VGVGGYAPSTALSRGAVVLAIVLGLATFPRTVSDVLHARWVAAAVTAAQRQEACVAAAKPLQRMARKAQAWRNLKSFVERTFARDFVEEARRPNMPYSNKMLIFFKISIRRIF
jgi:hypothetical protein